MPLFLLIAGCRNGKVERVETQPSSAPSGTLSGETLPKEEAKVAPSSQRTDRLSFDVEGTNVVVTLADAEAIKAALMERLKTSTVEGREALIVNTKNVPPSIHGGVLRIGIWILKPRDGHLTLTYRGDFGPAAAKLYTAAVTREGAEWKVGEVTLGQVRLRMR